jgi:hypothetical protein
VSAVADSGSELARDHGTETRLSGATGNVCSFGQAFQARWRCGRLMPPDHLPAPHASRNFVRETSRRDRAGPSISCKGSIHWGTRHSLPSGDRSRFCMTHPPVKLLELQALTERSVCEGRGARRCCQPSGVVLADQLGVSEIRGVRGSDASHGGLLQIVWTI